MEVARSAAESFTPRCSSGERCIVSCFVVGRSLVFGQVASYKIQSCNSRARREQFSESV